LAFVFLLSTAVGLAQEHPGLPKFNLLFTIAHYLSFKYFGWFAAGAAFYVFSQTRSNKWLAIALTAVIVCAATEGGADLSRLLAALLVSLLFAASVIVPAVQGILGNRFVQFFGAISYPFYLIHEGMMIAMIIKLKQMFGGMPLFLLPFPAIAVIALIAFIIGKYCEPAVRSLLMAAMPGKRVVADDALGLDKAV
jgi:peptidoglycan/LPS O-acetylase OafA/YrhL